MIGVLKRSTVGKCAGCFRPSDSMNSGTRRSSSLHQSSKAFTTSVALCPPNPNELFTATRTFFSFATFGV